MQNTVVHHPIQALSFEVYMVEYFFVQIKTE